MCKLLQTTILIQILFMLRQPPRVQDPAQFLFFHPASSNQHGCTEFLYTGISQGDRVRLACSDTVSAVVTVVGCQAVNRTA